MNEQTPLQIEALPTGQLEKATKRYPWFAAAGLLLWQRGGTLPGGVRLRQQFRPAPDFALQKPESAGIGGTFEIIEKFLEKAPARFVPAKESAAGEDLSRESVAEDMDLISEELAEIYAKQGLCSKAREIYAGLSLLNPEKSVYFAEILAGFGDPEDCGTKEDKL